VYANSITAVQCLKSVIEDDWVEIYSDSLLLAHLMGQYCFARWRLSESSVGVFNAAGRVGSQAADTAWRASTVMIPCLHQHCSATCIVTTEVLW